MIADPEREKMMEDEGEYPDLMLPVLLLLLPLLLQLPRLQSMPLPPRRTRRHPLWGAPPRPPPRGWEDRTVRCTSLE